MDLGLKGKRAMVVAASRGLGFATAAALAREGARVAICARSASGVTQAVDRLTAAGGQIMGGAVDVADADAYQTWIKDTVAQLGGLDVFVFNASAEGTDTSDDAWQRSLAIDLLGAKRGVESVLPALTASQGAIVFVASIVAGEKLLGPFAYNAAKAALVNYAKNLSAALGASGVRVNCVSPGPIELEGGAWARLRQEAPDFYAAIRGKIDLGRLGAPEDVARAVTFLASPAASFITGTNMLVDGGMSARTF